MWLEKRTYVKNWDWMEANDRHDVSVLKGGKPTLITPERVREIIEEVAYWRKANVVHRWFVQNVQQGGDNYAEYRVSEEQLRELLSACTQVLAGSELVDGEVLNCEKYVNGKWVRMLEKGKVIKDPSTARRLLPTQEGFFFGWTDYDESYLEDIKYTKDMLEQVLAEKSGGEYYYSSSW
jgi:hypothetical protein